jgi:hypothetical protein
MYRLILRDDSKGWVRESEFSRKCHLDSQIIIGLPTNKGEFSLMMAAFVGNNAKPSKFPMRPA